MLPISDDVVDDDFGHVQRRQRDECHQDPARQARDDHARRSLPHHPENRGHIFQRGDALTPSRSRRLAMGESIRQGLGKPGRVTVQLGYLY